MKRQCGRAQRSTLQRVPTVLTYRGQEVNEAPVC